MAKVQKHLVLDPDLAMAWLVDGSPDVSALVSKASESGARVWVTAATLSYLAREIESSLEQKQQLWEMLLAQTQILTDHGFEQQEVWLRARHPVQAQVAAAARSLPVDSTCIVSRDEHFDALGEKPVLTPHEALIWVEREETGQSMPFLDLAAQQARLRPQLERSMETVLRHGRYVLGPEVAELERKLADYVGVAHCITVSSGTDALLMALMALGIGPGDEVITTPFTFIATAEVITLVGARPCFVDVDAKTCLLDPARIEKAITPKTRAIIPVSLYGQCADFDRINEIAASHGLAVIEDGCQSFGALYKGRRSCGLSLIGVTSFFPSKPLACYGDGGAVFTNDRALAEKVRQIRGHGEKSRYRHEVLGLNGRLDSLQAAVLLARLSQFDWELEQRGEIAARYSEMLAGTDVVPPVIEPRNTSVYAQYTVQIEEREQLVRHLNAAGVPTAIHYPCPLHYQPVFEYLGYGRGAFPVAENLSRRVLSLPMGPDLSLPRQRQVVEKLLQALE